MYLPDKLYPLPKAKRQGNNTRDGKPRDHVYRVEIGGQTYYKVHVKRSEQSRIRYFKTRNEAKLFVEMLRENPYL